MISIKQHKSRGSIKAEIPSSKSLANRVLIIQAIGSDIEISHLSNSDDTRVLKDALNSFETKEEINIGHAGTSMRFLTSFLAFQKQGNWLLDGSSRMRERPIHPLVNALRSLGCSIEYKEKEGYPPLIISSSIIDKNELEIEGNISSQFISSLMLSAPLLEKELTINLKSKLTSLPYVKMTAALMQKFGVQCMINDTQIIISNSQYNNGKQIIEGDWSAASYWYSAVALSEDLQVKFDNLDLNSLQGDSRLMEIYTELGVSSSFQEDGLIIKKEDKAKEVIELDLSDCPDIAQTILVSCAGLGIECSLSGLHTLAIKETDRLKAMQNELKKFDIHIEITSDSAFLRGNQKVRTPKVALDTYHDHRMAMCFAPLSFITSLDMNNPEVVSKSYPNFWEDFSKILTIE